MSKYFKIEATNIHGTQAADFTLRRFQSIKEAIAAFDAIYNRKGWRIIIWRHNGITDPVCAKVLKSSFR